MQKINIEQFLGLQYEPPFGCFELVRQILEKQHNINLNIDTQYVQNTPNGRLQALHKGLIEKCIQVDVPASGDLILLRPAHIGYIVEPPYMLHSYSGGSACIERYDSFLWRNRILGFYRLRVNNDNS